MNSYQSQDSKCWILSYSDFVPEKEGAREVLTALGNAYFVIRGAFEESSDDGVHYPGTYIAGGYNRMVSKLEGGRSVENEDLVNWPNCLPLTFEMETGELFNLNKVTVVDFQQQLDLKAGRLQLTLVFEDRDGRRSRIRSERIVHCRMRHRACLRWEFEAQNWTGRIAFISGIDAGVKNNGVERYRGLESKHFRVVERGQPRPSASFVLSRALQSGLEVAQAVDTRFYDASDELIICQSSLHDDEEEFVAHRFELNIKKQRPIFIEKNIVLYTSRDFAISDPRTEAYEAIEEAPRFKRLSESHAIGWKQLWHRADINLADCPRAQLILRLHIFHLLQTVSHDSMDLDAGVPARGWHGEAYRGHIFWDEVFIFPFLNFRFPEVTRSLLLHRYRRLLRAKIAAKEEGFQGALFPWQSGSNGREESQKYHLNPRSGRWIPDHTYLQRHINSAIAYNIWNYFRVTTDFEFMAAYGVEMLLEIASFWSSACHYNSARQAYEIHGVVGPDEYHTAYPDSNHPGINNNAYTNVMAAWVLRRAAGVLELFAGEKQQELLDAAGIDPDEVERWMEISRKMFVPLGEDGIIDQFEGYRNLIEFDWETYRRKHGDIHRLDRILEAENDDVNRYRVCKQADVLMLFYLLSPYEIQDIFTHLGFDIDPHELALKNIQYYEPRSSHGSTLSSVVHAWVTARFDRETSWKLFEKALESDVSDIQGGTTAEGIHLGAMAGTVDLVQRCYSGMEVRGEVLWFDPALPESLTEVSFRLKFQGNWYSVRINHRELEIREDSPLRNQDRVRPARVGVKGREYEVQEKLHVAL